MKLNLLLDVYVGEELALYSEKVRNRRYIVHMLKGFQTVCVSYFPPDSPPLSLVPVRPPVRLVRRNPPLTTRQSLSSPPQSGRIGSVLV